MGQMVGLKVVKTKKKIRCSRLWARLLTANKKLNEKWVVEDNHLVTRVED